jgi:hypothetical protein
MTGEPLHPVGPELAVKNRRILAERLGWPAGTVEVCEHIEDETPGWSVTWSPGGDMTRPEPGFYAVPRYGSRDNPPFLHADTGDELRELLAGQPEPHIGLAEFHPVQWSPRD